MAMSRKMWLKLKLRFVANKLAEIFSRPWSDLRGISNSYAAKSTILIPLIAYWAIFNESVVKWLNLAREFVGAPVVDGISPRILWLYVALCVIALGTLIYGRRCPPEVKKYGDYRAYVNGDGPAMSASTMDDIEKDVERRGYALEGKITRPDYLEINFHELNVSNPVSRWSVTVCFAFGFGVLTILSGQVFWKVIHLLYQHPFG
jgi:hypothetical protein